VPRSQRAGADITYDGTDGDPSSSSFDGLGSVDLTQGGVNDRFRFDVTSATGSGLLSIELRSVNHGSSTLSLLLTPGIFDVPFSLFHFDGSPFAYPIDFHDVGYINFHFDMASGDAVTIDSVATVPEPSTLTLIIGLLVGSLAMRNCKWWSTLKQNTQPPSTGATSSAAARSAA
jgi:hypothetical protein